MKQRLFLGVLLISAVMQHIVFTGKAFAGGVQVDSLYEFSGSKAFLLKEGALACVSENGESIRVFDSKTGLLLKKFHGSASSNFKLFQLEDLSIVAVYRDLGFVKRWDWETQKTLISIDFAGERISAFAKLQDESIAVAIPNCPIKIFSLMTSQCLRSFSKKPGQVNSIVQLENGDIASGTEKGDIHIWGRKNFYCSTIMNTDFGPIKDVFLLSDKKRLAFTSSESFEQGEETQNMGLVQIWNPSKKYEPVQEFLGRIDNVFVAIELSGDRLATTAFGNRVNIWDLETRKRLNFLAGHEAKVRTLIQLKKSGLLVTGSNDQTVKVWDTETGECVETLIGHSGAVTSLLELGNGNLVSASDDGMVIVWSVQEVLS